MSNNVIDISQKLMTRPMSNGFTLDILGQQNEIVVQREFTQLVNDFKSGVISPGYPLKVLIGSQRFNFCLLDDEFYRSSKKTDSLSLDNTNKNQKVDNPFETITRNSRFEQTIASTFDYITTTYKRQLNTSFEQAQTLQEAWLAFEKFQQTMDVFEKLLYYIADYTSFRFSATEKRSDENLTSVFSIWLECDSDVGSILSITPVFDE